MRTYWHQAQDELSQLKPPPWNAKRGRPGDPFNVRIEEFTFEASSLAFSCAGYLETAGCFNPPRHIQYWASYPEVIKHEAKHAILYRLGDPRWKCIEHPGGC